MEYELHGKLDHQYVDWLISINKIIVIYYFNNKVSSFAGVIVHLFLSKKMLVYLEKYYEAQKLGEAKQNTTKQKPPNNLHYHLFIK